MSAIKKAPKKAKKKNKYNEKPLKIKGSFAGAINKIVKASKD